MAPRLLLLLLVAVLIIGVSSDALLDCKGLLQEFYKFNVKEAAPYTGDNLVYFLHVPRTAGRTFHSCLLRLGTKGRRRCPKAYDHLRIDFTVPHCYLLSSHDDFSVVEQLPDNTAVVSQLRDPLDRLLSAYEFAIEVAARQLRRSKGYVKPKNRVITDDVWPWTYLIPYFLADMKPKIAAAKAEPLKAPGVWSEQRSDEGKIYYWNKYLNTSKWTLTDEERQRLVPNLDPYNNQLFMPLADFIQQPIARELLHNGETFQVLGLTNYSHWDKAADMRKCMLEDKAIADELLEFALKRIERFTHVGTTNKLFDSVESAAASLAMPLDGLAYGAGEAPNANVETGRALAWEDAMKLGEAPVPTATDDNYGNARPGALDMHQLAAGVRKKRAAMSWIQQLWNKAVEEEAPQSHLRDLRGQLNAERAELSEAQDLLVTSRAEEAKKRELAQQGSQEDKTLDHTLGFEFNRCAKRAQTRNHHRKKNSLLNLRLNDYRQVYFSKEDRSMIPSSLQDEIRQLNDMDEQLYKRAMQLLEKKREGLAAKGKLQKLPPPASEETSTARKGEPSTIQLETTLRNDDDRA
eukprot:gene11842-11986_t